MIRNANQCVYARYLATKCRKMPNERITNDCANAKKLDAECSKGKLVHFGCGGRGLRVVNTLPVGKRK